MMWKVLSQGIYMWNMTVLSVIVHNLLPRLKFLSTDDEADDARAMTIVLQTFVTANKNWQKNELIISGVARWRKTVLIVLNRMGVVFKGGVGGPPPENFAKIGTKFCNSRGFHESLGLHIELHSCVTIRGVYYINVCIIWKWKDLKTM